MKKEIISSRQYTFLVTLFVIGTGILIIPASMVEMAGPAASLSAIIGTVISVIVVWFYIRLCRITPNLTIFELNEKYLGKWLGKFISLTMVYLTTVTSAELLYFVGDFMTTNIMPETPALVFQLLFACVIVMAVHLGIETFTRSLEIMLPIFMLLFILLVVLLLKDIEAKNLSPFFEKGPKSIIKSTFYFVSIYSLPQIFLLSIFPASITETKQAEKGFLKGTIIGGTVLVLIVFLCITVLGVDGTARQTFPSYTLTKTINIGKFIQRIEVISGLLWIITIYSRSVVYYFSSVIGLATILNMKDHKPLILPLATIVVPISLIVHPNVIHANVFTKDTWGLYIATYGLLLPLILWIVSKIRKPKNTTQTSSTPKT